MSDISPVLSLPLLQPSQAQKHVTHNEALMRLDMLVQATAVSRNQTIPPATPAQDALYVVPQGGTLGWAGQDGALALFDQGAWVFLPPKAGWRVWVLDEAGLIVWDGSAWHSFSPASGTPSGLGINTSFDATNRLAVSSPATLFNHEGDDHRLKINKAGAGDTASVLFQTGFSGRAEMGIAGGDDWSIKVSPNGATWTDALVVAASSGQVSGAAVQASPDTAQPGTLLTAGTHRLAQGPTSIDPSLDQIGGTWLAGVNDDATAPFAVTGQGGDRFGVVIQAQRANARRHQIVHTLTGQLFHRHETDAGWAPYARVIDSTNLLGAVSLAGGVPTGAVIETGQTADGTFTRFADGTQICIRVVEGAEISSADSALGTHRSAVESYPFPAAFTQPPACSVSRNALGGAGLWAEIGADDSTSWQLRWLAGASFTDTAHGGARLMAIGRWV